MVGVLVTERIRDWPAQKKSQKNRKKSEKICWARIIPNLPRGARSKTFSAGDVTDKKGSLFPICRAFPKSSLSIRARLHMYVQRFISASALACRSRQREGARMQTPLPSPGPNPSLACGLGWARADSPCRVHAAFLSSQPHPPRRARSKPFAPARSWPPASWRCSLAPLASCLLYTSPSPRDGLLSRMPSSA